MLAVPDDRRYPKRPILGVGAIIIEAGCILLVERGREPLKGYWSLPGGAVEVGESLAEAVRRETLEETSLEIEPLSVVEIFERITRDAGGLAEYHYVLIDYLCRPTGGALRHGSDVAAAEFVDPTDLARFRLTPKATSVIEKALTLARSQSW